MVLVGVSGEFALRRQKGLPEIKPDDLETVKFSKRTLTIRRMRWEDIWESALIIGLALELIALPENLSEVARLNVISEKLRSTNLVLEAQVLELKTKQSPRTITSEQRASLIKCLDDCPKGKVFIMASVLDFEATDYAAQIESVLTNSGFEVTRPTGFRGDSVLAVSSVGMHLIVKDRMKAPAHAGPVQRCFIGIGIPLMGVAPDDPNFESNRVEIVIGPRF